MASDPDIRQWPDKDPVDVADYVLHFDDLFPVDDPILGAAWEIVPPGLTINAQGYVSRSAVITLSGGVTGTTYRLTATVNSSQRIFRRNVLLFVRDKI